MSIGSAFSSPSKAGQQAASSELSTLQPLINQQETYQSGQEQNLRNAISGLGPNPYFGAGGTGTPPPIDPTTNTATFSSAGPGTQVAGNAPPAVVAPAASPIPSTAFRQAPSSQGMFIQFPAASGPGTAASQLRKVQ